ncbi:MULTISPECIES: caspase family protein [unclassified Bradyrhizobium]|uniref:caspase family protein n=1 Tax=unclassified Bradyrhizobium TaxID=2631580 RepID=UPI0029169495|nr:MULTISPECIES: caspase family protein [unclassified Bradyrhizobium]
MRGLSPGNKGARSYARALCARYWALGSGVLLLVAAPFASHSGLQQANAADDARQVATEQAYPLESREGARLVATVGHVQGITSLVWSSDGKQLFSGSADNSAKLWDFASGSLIRSFSGSNDDVRGMRNSVSAVAFGKGGTEVIIGASNGATRWDLGTGSARGNLEAPSNLVTAVAVAHGGSQVAIAGNGPASEGAKPFVHLHSDVSRSLPLIGDHSINALAFSRDGKWLATGGADKLREVQGGVQVEGAIHIWDAQSAAGVASWSGPKDGINWVQFSPEGDVLYALSPGTLSVRSLPDGKEVRSFMAYNAALSPDGGWLALDAGDGSDSPNARVADIRNSRSGDLVVSVPWPPSDDEKVRSRVLSLAFRPDGSSLAIGFNNGKIAIWDFTRKAFSLVRASREWGASKPIAIDGAGKNLVVAGDRGLAIWNFDTGVRKPLSVSAKHDVDVVAISRDGNIVAAGSKQGGIIVWDAVTGKQIADFLTGLSGITALGLSHDGKKLIVGTYSIARVLTVSGEILADLGNRFPIIRAAAFRPGDTELVVGDEAGEVSIFSGWRWQRKRTIPPPGINATVQDVAFDAGGHRMIVGYGNGYNRAVVHDLDKGNALSLAPHNAWIWSVALSPDGSRAITGSGDETAALWDLNTGNRIATLARPGVVLGVGFAMSGTDLLAYSDRTVTLHPLSSPADFLQLVELGVDRWAVAAQDGRFDTNDLDNVRDLNWFMPDDPLRPLSLEVFMRDYLEPGLLARSVSCRLAMAQDPKACDSEFPAVAQISKLNRVLPKVSITGFRAGETIDDVVVTVEVEQGRDPTQKNGKISTDAYDLRLFRNNQLVKRLAPGVAADYRRSPSSWRDAMRVAGTKFEFTVRLPRRKVQKEIRFAAYAFNEDRAKSGTAHASYSAPADPSLEKPKAYVVTIGINDYLEGGRDLKFATKDAMDTAKALQAIRGFDVVSTSLLSERPVLNASKKKLRAAFRVLAGDESARAILADVPDSGRLQQAAPEDLVIITFSGHGYTQRDGTFYLVPSDARASADVTPDVLSSFVSSEELSEWLEGVDAGQLALVIDACHSAASVKAAGFKPGPLGDRGLGQLAYDKGMRILAASQEAQAAIELGKLRQGLLTYALVQEGLGASGGPLRADTDHNSEVTLDEWLRYGESRTPRLYDDARAGKIPIVVRDSTVDPSFITAMVARLQTPVLFNYHRGVEEAIIRKR